MVQSAKLLSWIGMAKGMPWIGKRQPLHCFLTNTDGTTQIDYRISACTKQPLRPWMLVPDSLVILAAEVRLKLMIIRVNLQFLYRRPNLELAQFTKIRVIQRRFHFGYHPQDRKELNQPILSGINSFRISKGWGYNQKYIQQTCVAILV
ncbi:Hypothetical_protein [Hexamita inflata]|uniref:Hypothetical_protein n=1 Tax=Hexamita inflata TaxID=28002 RepID=A0AA86PMX2_9EUKA|nr:Hypothetical protein HINF_LOCUS29186 [Hexamita inflata]